MLYVKVLLLFCGLDVLGPYTLPEYTVVGKYPTKGPVVLLAKLINSEAGGEIEQGQYAVASVVINRMRYQQKSLTSVIFAKGQFDGVRTKRFKWYTRKHYVVAYRALICNQTNLPPNVLFFMNVKTSTDTKWVRHIIKKKYVNLGNHTFCSL